MSQSAPFRWTRGAAQVAQQSAPFRWTRGAAQVAQQSAPFRWIREAPFVTPPPIFGGPTGGSVAANAPTQIHGGPTAGFAKFPPPKVFSEPTAGFAKFPPPRGLSGPTGGRLSALVSDTYGGPVEGQVLVAALQNYGPSTYGRINSLPPLRGFGASTGGVTEGLASPVNLTATVIDAGCIRLDWIDTSTEEDGYRIERSLTTQNDWDVIGLVDADIETFLDRFAVPLVIYDYQIIGFDADRESLPSNIATAVTPLPPDISTGEPPVSPTDPPRNRIQPDPITFESPGIYGLAKDENGDVTGFKF